MLDRERTAFGANRRFALFVEKKSLIDLDDDVRAVQVTNTTIERDRKRENEHRSCAIPTLSMIIAFKREIIIKVYPSSPLIVTLQSVRSSSSSSISSILKPTNKSKVTDKDASSVRAQWLTTEGTPLLIYSQTFSVRGNRCPEI